MADENIRLRRVATGRGGFLVVPSAPRRLRDPNAVFLEKANTIPPLTPSRHFADSAEMTQRADNGHPAGQRPLWPERLLLDPTAETLFAVRKRQISSHRCLVSRDRFLYRLRIETLRIETRKGREWERGPQAAYRRLRKQSSVSSWAGSGSGSLARREERLLSGFKRDWHIAALMGLIAMFATREGFCERLRDDCNAV